MKRMAAICGIILLLAPIALFAKGDTVRIISGGSLIAPIEITDPALVGQFNIWSGSGASSHDAEGLNVDWPRGMAQPPKGLEGYRVSFANAHSQPSTYVVRYVLDPATG